MTGLVRDRAALGGRLEADFAERGWSFAFDVGTRLSFGDAAALRDELLGDTSTRCGAFLAGLSSPMPMASILTLGAVGGERAVRSLFRDAGDVRRDLSFRSTPEEERRALESMSDIWNRVG